MKKLALLLALLTPLAKAADAPGSAAAAKAMIPAYLGQLFTLVDTPVVKGDHATVHARILDQSCDLTLVKHPTANESGWVVEKQACKKI
jgi:hypothetical protein